MTEHWTNRLSDYLDEDMDPRERRRVEAHLAECEMCAAALADLRRIVAEAAALEDVPPERNLWPGIAERLGERRAVVVPLESAARARRRFSLSLPQLAAAVLAVLLVGVGGAWLALEEGGSADPTVAEAPRRAPGEDRVDTSPIVAVAEDADQTSYAEAVADLEARFEETRDRLDPETVRAVQQNLAIIDQALAEIRAALAEDPNDPYLNRHLATTMRRKVDVLRQATEAVI
ncbi:MAG: zf-HC2 domain-containing protein [Gemmatimonadetes bacterium]|nr:zf-HC2 domain-containing protein [Gemmatimonadota bacterium]